MLYNSGLDLLCPRLELMELMEALRYDGQLRQSGCKVRRNEGFSSGIRLHQTLEFIQDNV
jgi:hypothetical protein